MRFHRVLKSFLAFAALASLALAPASAEEDSGAAEASAAKRDVPSAQLLLPFFRVEKENIFGLTTLWAVRNESGASAQLTVRYFRPDLPQSAEKEEVFTLEPRQVKTVNIRDVDGLFVDDDGFATGYVTFAVGDGQGPIQGDFFLITPGEAFASGDRLVDIDPSSLNYEPCQRPSLRYLNGGAFSGGTQLTVWVETDQPIDADEPLFFYSVYGEAGGEEPIFTLPFFAEEAAFRVPVAALLVSPLPTTPPAFGVLELELQGDLRAHVATVMDANGLYSVGLKAACKDP